MSNLPLFVHQHMLHSAVKCLPPQHVHSGMPHTVQLPHSVKMICNDIMEVVGNSQHWDVIYLFLCSNYIFTLFCKCTLAPCCSNTLTTSTCPLSDATIRGVDLFCPNTNIRSNKDLIVMLLWYTIYCLQFHCPVSTMWKCLTYLFLYINMCSILQ